MHIIKLDAIDSTNAFLKKKSSAEKVEDYTVVHANFQSQGRGQMGTRWSSEPNKNLTISAYKDVSFINIDDSFYISIVTSLAIIKALQGFSIPKMTIKWPNDILSDDKKVCGILIENVIKQDRLSASIIGIGLNVNQTNFTNLENASSLKYITGTVYDLDEIIENIVINLKHYFSILESGMLQELKEQYESVLFRKNKPSTFKNAEGEYFSGFIKSISNSGNLQVLVEDAIIKEFDLKEISLMY